MNSLALKIVSAYGRGETLALALHNAGFHVQILDCTQGFPAEYQRGAGPFPIVRQNFLPEQSAVVDKIEILSGGLCFWLKGGPIELTGPLAKTHVQAHPEIEIWKSGASGGVFSQQWLRRFMRQWAAPYYCESWIDSRYSLFPAELPLGLIPMHEESSVHSFARAHSQGIEVHPCTGFLDANIQEQRVSEIEVQVGNSRAIQADRWIWCLSSSETAQLGASAAQKLFSRGIRQPEWTWISFEGQMSAGPWTKSLPHYLLVVGDIYLPWTYANVSVLRRLDKSRLRFWMKVPQAQVNQIDARRAWASDLKNLLQQRLRMADWKIDSSQWSLCPHSEIYPAIDQGENLAPWKNWDWISPETLPRLDVSARLRIESEVYRRLLDWRADLSKKQGAKVDHSLHAP